MVAPTTQLMLTQSMPLPPAANVAVAPVPAAAQTGVVVYEYRPPAVEQSPLARQFANIELGLSRWGAESTPGALWAVRRAMRDTAVALKTGGPLQYGDILTDLGLAASGARIAGVAGIADAGEVLAGRTLAQIDHGDNPFLTQVLGDLHTDRLARNGRRRWLTADMATLEFLRILVGGYANTHAVSTLLALADPRDSHVASEAEEALLDTDTDLLAVRARESVLAAVALRDLSDWGHETAREHSAQIFLSATTDSDTGIHPAVRAMFTLRPQGLQ